MHNVSCLNKPLTSTTKPRFSICPKNSMVGGQVHHFLSVIHPCRTFWALLLTQTAGVIASGWHKLEQDIPHSVWNERGMSQHHPHKEWDLFIHYKWASIEVGFQHLCLHAFQPNTTRFSIHMQHNKTCVIVWIENHLMYMIAHYKRRGLIDTHGVYKTQVLIITKMWFLEESDNHFLQIF